jgi:voltage-gated potassium channel Kch
MKMHRPHIPRRFSYGATCALTLALVAWIIAGPVDGDTWYLAITTLLGGLILTTTVRTAREAGLRRGVPLIGVALAAVATGGIASSTTSTPEIPAASILLLVGTYVPFTIIKELNARREVSVQLMFGAITIYLLIGLVSSMLLVLTVTIQDAPTLLIDGVPSDGDFRTQVYFSYVTLATVGYGDVTPLSGASRAIALLTALVGQLFLVSAVALTVGMLSSIRSSRVAAPQEHSS